MRFNYLFSVVFMFLRVVSFNARGLMDVEKFENMKEICRGVDVFVLQETNWKNDCVKRFENLWDGNIHCNNSTEKTGKGVAILIRRDVCEKESVVFNDGAGKCLAVEIEKGDERCTVYNIHAPNEEKEKLEFFKTISDNVRIWERVILMGDFNTVFTELDLASNMVFKTDKGREELKKMMGDFKLIDVWRERNRTSRQFSRRQFVLKELKQSRIDYVLCTEEMQGNISNVYYKRAGFSDHSFLFLTLDFTSVERGGGVWVLNAKVLKSNAYQESIKWIVEESKMYRMYREEKRVWWDSVKWEIKKCSIEYSKNVRKVERQKEMELTKQLNNELRKAAESNGKKEIEKIIMLQDQLKIIEEEKCKGASIRSKAKYAVEGERCTSFFFNLEKNRQKADLLKEVLNQKGEIETGTEGILKLVKQYYMDMFKGQGIGKKDEEFLIKQIKSKLTGEDMFFCDEDIKEEEIDVAIQQLKPGKSPGVDGLINEFYKTFREILVPILKEVFEEIFKKEVLSEKMKIGMIKMIYKRRGNPKDLKNFRPISMLNTDFKILAKVLANRLKKVLPKIIKTTQAYGVQGRDIADVVKSIRDTIYYMKEKGKGGFLISLDLEKAFDRVEHEFLFDVLKAFGFGENFRKWIRIFYSDVLTCIKCNGFLTDCFQPTRSIRQGCPLSALLYSLVAEPLGLAIKADGEIKGIQIKDNCKREAVYQYADDTTLMVEDIQSIDRAMGILERYCKGSGAKVNVGKSLCMRIGRAEEIPQHIQLKEETQHIKILGVWVGMDSNKADILNWEGVLNGMGKRLRFWQARDLTLKGKVLIINSLMLSKVWYVLGVTPLPQVYYKRMKELVLKFLWGNGRAKIAYNTLLGDIKEGGLGLLDPFLRMRTLRIKTVQKFLEGNSDVIWKSVMKYYLKKWNMGCNVLWMKMKSWMLTGLPNFYVEVFESWGQFLENVLNLPKGRAQLLEQPLFLNPNIKREGEVMYYKEWWDCGLRQIKDLLYEVIEGYLPLQVVVDALREGGKRVWRMKLDRQYEDLKKAIPKDWIERIENYESGEEDELPEVFFKRSNGEKVNFNLCKVRNFYSVFRSMAFTKPVALSYWKERYDELNENEFWGNVRLKYMEPILENFNYLLRHNCMLTEMRLHKIGIQNDAKCKVCMKENEGLLHLFFYCEKLDDFMRKMKDIAKSIFEGKYEEDQKKWEKMFLFGCNDCKMYTFNLCVTVAKYVIWLRRNMAKYDGKNVDVWIIFKNRMEYSVRLLWNYFLMENKEDDFIEIIVRGNPMLEIKENVVNWLWGKYEK